MKSISLQRFRIKVWCRVSQCDLQSSWLLLKNLSLIIRMKQLKIWSWILWYWREGKKKKKRKRVIDNVCFLPWRSTLAHSRKTTVFWMESSTSKNKVSKTTLLCQSQPQMTFPEITHDCSGNNKTLVFLERKAVPSQDHMFLPKLDYGFDHQASALLLL